MSIQQAVPLTIVLVGDGVSLAFTFPPTRSPVDNLSHTSSLGANIIPVAAQLISPPVPASVSVDTFGNVTITTVSAIPNLVAKAFEVRLLLGSYPILVSDSALKVTTIAPGAGSADAFGRMRVADPTTIFQLLYQYDTQPLFMQFSNVGTGSTVKTTNESSLTLSTGGTLVNAQAIAQTKEYFAYEPGKSQLILISAVLNFALTNGRQRLGYFDVNNGIFFEMAGVAGVSLVLRSNASGSIVETRVPQASWNIDKVDGTGSSGVTVDFSKSQVFVIDFQWLGAGRVRFGFFINGVYTFVHSMPLSNSLTGPYMNTACLPVRAEITNTGVPASADTMKVICISVVSEGGQEKPLLLNFGASTGATVASVTTRRPILSIRPKLLFAGQTNRTRIFLSDLVILSNQKDLEYELVYNGVLTGSVFSSVDSNSGVEKDTSATSIAGGTIYKTGYASTDEIAQVNPVCRYPFTLDITGTVQDIISVVATTVPSGATSTSAAFTWEELR